jgi:cell division protein FtsL
MAANAPELQTYQLNNPAATINTYSAAVPRTVKYDPDGYAKAKWNAKERSLLGASALVLIFMMMGAVYFSISASRMDLNLADTQAKLTTVINANNSAKEKINQSTSLSQLTDVAQNNGMEHSSVQIKNIN